ncbi:MAG: sugar ABC transporter permease [Geminicoccaceae bacterium]
MGQPTRFPLLWVGAPLLLVALLTVLPIAHTLWTSLHSAHFLFPDELEWSGLANYRKVVTGPFFLTTLKNSLLFTVVTAPVVVGLGIATALLLRERFLGRTVVRSVVLLPWVLPGAITAVLWIWVFNPSWGILNQALRDLGLIRSAVPWLSDPSLAFVSVAAAHVWAQVPFSVVLTLAALSTVDPALVEAAKIDGATGPQRFRFVTWPAIKAMVVVLLIYNALTAFTTYDVVYAMTGGGPGTATSLLSFQIWRESFSMYDFGAGSAVAFLVVAMAALMIVLITRSLPSDLFAATEEKEQ